MCDMLKVFCKFHYHYLLLPSKYKRRWIEDCSFLTWLITLNRPIKRTKKKIVKTRDIRQSTRFWIYLFTLSYCSSIHHGECAFCPLRLILKVLFNSRMKLSCTCPFK